MEFAPDDPLRPVVYIAPLSHASYFKPNSHPYFFGIDHPYADGPAASDLAVVAFGPWVNWEGRWGSTERTIGGRIGGGPKSPRWQNPKWERPGIWHRRMRYRRVRALLGRMMHALGRLTYPHPPRIAASPEAGTVSVHWELNGRGSRRRRHLYVTLHERHFVIASRILEDAEGRGTTAFLVPAERRPTAVMASAYNRMRQRSDVAQAALE